MTTYYDNWMGGLAMHMLGPVWLLLMLNAFVVFVGFLILSGAVNTSIVGSNGVLSRVAEDGVLPDWFLRPHPRVRHELSAAVHDRRFATADDCRQSGRRHLAGRGVCVRRRVEFCVQHAFDGRAAVQEAAGRASFSCRLIFDWRQCVFADRAWGWYFLIDVSFGDRRILFTKPVATTSGLCFAGAFLTIFTITEYIHRKRRGTEHHEHIEQFNRETVARSPRQTWA